MIAVLVCIWTKGIRDHVLMKQIPTFVCNVRTVIVTSTAPCHFKSFNFPFSAANVCTCVSLSGQSSTASVCNHALVLSCFYANRAMLLSSIHAEQQITVKALMFTTTALIESHSSKCPTYHYQILDDLSINRDNTNCNVICLQWRCVIV